MTNIRSVLVFTLLLACGICEDNSTTTSVDSTTIEIKTETTTVPSTSSVTSTPQPTTESQSTPHPTTQSSSTTSEPTTQSTPTSQPTTRTVPTSQPTTIQTTSTSQPTTVVPVTTPEPPAPQLTEWNVTEGNITCIRADLKARFKIPIEGDFEYINLSPNASNEGSKCNSTNGTQLLELTDSDYKFSMIFEKDGNSKTYVKKIELVYNLPPNIIGDVTSDDTPLFSVQLGSSYLCNSGTVDLQNVTMEIMHIQLRSFGGKEILDFGTVEECDADNKVNDLVPIVVGCALLALVVIVLIAYFVGRRRSRQKGYQSV